MVFFWDRLLVVVEVSASIVPGMLRVPGRSTPVVPVASTRRLAGALVTTLDLTQASFLSAFEGSTVEPALWPQQNGSPLLPLRNRMLAVVLVRGS